MPSNTIEVNKRRFGIIGNTPALNHAIEMAIQVAPTNMGVLITGENGSGKESFAKIIHHLSTRKHGKFIAINCGAIPEGTIDSELFGHEKGAFTSASEARKGYFEEANQGTIFLDEIGEMPLHTQPKLLRVLENKEYMRVGSSQKKHTDARVVAATNIDLQQYIKQKKFREDLYYRVAQVQIIIPPLRERKEDIPLLANKFALEFVEMHHAPLIQFTTKAQEVLVEYPFPGNIRQLRNIIWQMAALESKQPLIDKGTLMKYLPEPVKPYHMPAITSNPYQGGSFMERDMLKIVFEIKGYIQNIQNNINQLLQSQVETKKIMKTYADLVHFFYPINKQNQAQVRKMLEEPTANPLALPAAEKSPKPSSEAILSLKKNEKKLIQKALSQYKSYKEAANKLGISERTLYRKIHSYQLQVASQETSH